MVEMSMILNQVIYWIERPYERFSDYEELLTILERDDTEKYKTIPLRIGLYKST